jgi:hypothetical protein
MQLFYVNFCYVTRYTYNQEVTYFSCCYLGTLIHKLPEVGSIVSISIQKKYKKYLFQNRLQQTFSKH